MTLRQRPYDVTLHRRVERFVSRHTDLLSRWDDIRHSISISPRRGGNISHLKGGKLQCDYRWRQGDYRLMYEVMDDVNEVHVYNANTRGDVY